MRFILLMVIFLCVSSSCGAQQAAYKTFTVNDGLPSNNIYRCMEDDKGFLWIGTDAGIARFDGKNFQVFTTQQGLPDNDVLAIEKEKNGRIWVNCFKQSPAYFDEVKNRFINAVEDSNLAKVSGTGSMMLFALPGGGVVYYNEKGFYIFRDKKLIEYKTKRINDVFLIKENGDGSQLRFSNRVFDSSLKIYRSRILHSVGQKYLDSLDINSNRGYAVYMTPVIDDGKFYLFNKDNGKFFIYTGFEINPLHFKLDSVTIAEPFFNYAFTDSCLYVVTTTGKIYVYNKMTLKQKYIISGNYSPNSFYNDSKGNIWVSTIDKGLIVYKKKQIGHVSMPAGYTRTNFTSIALTRDGKILAGNYYDEVLETDGSKFIIHAVSKKGNSRQRKILEAGNNIFTFSDGGVKVNYSKQPVFSTNRNKVAYSLKAAIIYNDSIILAGYYAGLLKLNTITQTIANASAVSKRVTAITKTNNGKVYFGSIDGLYRYEYAQNSFVSLAAVDPAFKERVIAICSTPDNITWIATSDKGVVAMKDEKVLLKVTMADGINNNFCRSIAPGKPGQVWLSTVAGVSIINYRWHDNKIDVSIQNISVNDGLTSNEVNEMVYHNDTIYAATSDGISVIPGDIAIPRFNIPLQIVNIKINQRDTSIGGTYDLAYDQQNIFIRFAGIELGGHFKNVQYTIDDNKQWINLQENTLNLQLGSGQHIIQARAVDVNGNNSNQILTVKFVIATPFWRAIWFWIIVIVVIQSISILLLLRSKINKNKRRLLKEIAGVQTAALEQQAFTSLMNPHFIFNALNSIQHYINVQDRQSANRYLTDFASLIRKNFEAAQQSFIPLEQELENLRIYLRLEQMRFTNRFTYQIVIDKNLDVDDWMIPTMMLQPLLENALLHGIMRSAIDGKLTIECNEQDKNLIITITDNGIGIVNSTIAKENGEHKSHGMGLIRKRMAALSYFVADPITIKMSPASQDDNNPGNQVTVFIPGSLHKAWLQAQQK